MNLTDGFLWDWLPAEFHFLRPDWLWALLPFLWLLWLLARRNRGGAEWQAVCDEALLPHVLSRKPGQHKHWPMATLALGGLLMITALAGPAWERQPQPVFRDLSSLVVGLDLSRSMDAQDIAPSRLARARFKLTDILQRRKEGQTGLVVFAGDAFTVSPLTDDQATIIAQLPSMTTDLMPSQGSRGDRALDKAADLLRQSGQTRGDILLITDGFSPAALDAALDAALNAAQKNLHEQAYRVSFLIVGSADGAPIPQAKGAGGGFVKDASGNIVVARVQAAPLCDLAARTGGLCLTLSSDESDVNTLSDFFENQRETRNVANTDLKTDVWKEAGPWLLLLLIPLAALAFRRGLLAYLPPLLLVSSLLPGHPLEAAEPPASSTQPEALNQPHNTSALKTFAELLPKDLHGWFLTPEQRGRLAMAALQPEQAAQLFQDPRWQAAAQYRLQHYQDGLQTLEQAMQAPETELNPAQQADDQYNLGNLRARKGDLNGAIAAYDKALEQQPALEDARYNRDLIKQWLEQNPPPQQTQDPDSKQQGEEGQGAGAGSNQMNDRPGEGQKSDAEEQQGGEGDQDRSTSGAEGEQRQDKPSDRNETDQIKPDQQDAATHQARSALNQQDPNAEAESKEAPEQGQRQQEGTQPNAEQGSQHERHSADETRQATEQWLRRIPDDPGGLWRRKFLYQYQAQQRQTAPRNNGRGNEEPAW